MRPNTPNTLAIFGMCALGTVAIALVYHTVVTLPPITKEEFMSIYLYQGLLNKASLIVLFALAVSAGFFGSARKRWVMLGFIAPFGIAVIYEISRFKQSHNLLPVEILLNWGPIGIIAALGCWVGKLLVRRLRPQTPNA